MAKSPEMLTLMLDWEDKKTDYKHGQAVRLQLGDILDQVNMEVGTFKYMVADFNAQTVGIENEFSAHVVTA